MFHLLEIKYPKFNYHDDYFYLCLIYLLNKHVLNFLNFVIWIRYIESKSISTLLVNEEFRAEIYCPAKGKKRSWFDPLYTSKMEPFLTSISYFLDRFAY